MGALFFIDALPSFLDGVLSPRLPVSPNIMRSSRQAQYQSSIAPHYGSPHNSDPNSSEEGCVQVANHGQDPYRYIMPRDATYPNLGQDSSSSQATWSKTEAENDYTTFPPAH